MGEAHDHWFGTTNPLQILKARLRCWSTPSFAILKMYGSRRFKPTLFKSRRKAYTRRSSKARTQAAFRKRVLRIVAPESKFRLIGVQQQPIVGAQSESLITNMGIGSSATTRVGNWIKTTRIDGNWTITADPAAAADTVGVRVGLACWKNDQSVDPFSAGRIMGDAAAPGGWFSVTEKDAYRVIYSKYVNLVNNGDNSQLTKVIPFNLDLSKLPKVLYDGANEKKNHLFFFSVSDDIVGASPPQVNIEGTLRYSDS